MLTAEICHPQTFQSSSNVHPRVHAKQLDRDLGFRTSKIEEKLSKKFMAYDCPTFVGNKKKHYPDSEAWIGLDPQVLQVSYDGISKAFNFLKDEEVSAIVDIGAGYGRVGLVMNSIFPKATFCGFEILKQRATEGNRIFEKFALDNCHIITKNVLDGDFVLPEADIYFIYDFSDANDISFILGELSKMAEEKNIFLVTKGDRVDRLMKWQYRKYWKEENCFSSQELRIYSSAINSDKE